MSFRIQIFPMFPVILGGCDNTWYCWMKCDVSSDLYCRFPNSPEGVCSLQSVTSKQGLLTTLSGTNDGYHLNTSRQKSSRLCLYFLSCYGDEILFCIYKLDFLLVNYQLISLAYMF